MGVLRFPFTIVAVAAAGVAVPALPAWAQTPDYPAPAHVATVDGDATLEREGQVEPAVAGVPFIPGDRLQTLGGRVEILFPDGSVLDVDEYSLVDLQSVTLLRLTDGRVLLTVAGADDPASALSYQIDTPAASVTTSGPGEYRISLLTSPADLQVELAVTRGLASFANERGVMTVRAGERSLARELDVPSYPQVFNSARFDAFDRWAARQRESRLGTHASADYLPPDLQIYGGVLDRSGTWAHEAPYGYVWYPTVASTWRPYFDGYWSAIRPYGWTWIGVDVWAWPTHHYGRWGFVRSRWFWIPHHRWSPAWVSWGSAPGYVSWCPLGFDNRPVFALSVAFGSRWDGWVTVPHGYFGGYPTFVGRHAIAPHRLDRINFVSHTSAPVEPRYAVPRHRVAGPVAREEAQPSGPAGRAAPRPGVPRAQQGAPVSEGPRRALEGRSERGLAGRQPIARDPRPDAGDRSTAAVPDTAGRTGRSAVTRDPQRTTAPPAGTTGRTGRSVVTRDPQRATAPDAGTTGPADTGRARPRQPLRESSPPASSGAPPPGRSPRSRAIVPVPSVPSAPATPPGTADGGRRSAAPRSGPVPGPSSGTRRGSEARPGALADPQPVPMPRTPERPSRVRSQPPPGAAPASPERSARPSRVRPPETARPPSRSASPPRAVPRNPGGGSRTPSVRGGATASSGSGGRETPARRRRP